MRRWIAERLIDHLYWWESRVWGGLYSLAVRLRHGEEAPAFICWGCAQSYVLRKKAERVTGKIRHPKLYP